jgi:16S rRNA (guanine(1405)-N(7))-methyltransferase
VPDYIEQEAEAIVSSIKHSKKYRDTYEGTIRELVRAEIPKHKRWKEVEKAVRERLHRIMAFYVGDPDYEVATIELQAAFDSGDQDTIRNTCTRILSSHASTRERLEVVDSFYSEIFAVTGKPQVILDIACALNPLTFPWMNLPTTIEYYAYDIHKARVDFLNAFFALQGLPMLAKVQDVAFEYPEQSGDVAFFLKEIHRFEQNYDKRGLALLEALRVHHLVVSFPTVSFHGGRSLTEHYRRSFYELIGSKKWPVLEFEFHTELVFCIDKTYRSLISESSFEN